MNIRLAAMTLALPATLALPVAAHAHATYNTFGYGSGLAGSTNGADGSPTAEPGAVWTNGGVADYTGNLPATWYAGMHNATTVRTIQTGLAPNPPAGSLLEQINSYNTSIDPDLPTDLVLGVGGKSWTDPANANQGWGHGLDYGLVHFSPVETILAGGPVAFTVTVADDPTDAVAVQLAFAVYGNWDDNPSSLRHQTFFTDPAPGDNPLSTTNLVLLDYAVATAAGQTISRTFELTSTYGGEYTILVGALGGVSGQYQVTVSSAPSASSAALEQCETDLDAATGDTDDDGVPDAYDDCPVTPAMEAVDVAGCSQAEFCAAIDATTRDGFKACQRADWNNDEPAMSLSKKKGQIDCIVDKVGRGRDDDLCVVAPSVP
jgi:hypothetical protein